VAGSTLVTVILARRSSAPIPENFPVGGTRHPLGDCTICAGCFAIKNLSRLPSSVRLRSSMMASASPRQPAPNFK
jgi:hypothetical protein